MIARSQFHHASIMAQSQIFSASQQPEQEILSASAGGKPPLLPRKRHQVLDLGPDAERFIERMVVMAGHEA